MRRLLAWGLLVLVIAGAAGWWAWSTGRLDRWRGVEASAGGERAGERAAGRGGQQPGRAGGAGAGGRRAGGPFDPNQSIPVQAALARAGDIDVVINALGTVTARNTVTVRSRVEGQLVRIAFREGQQVKAGDLLAEVDPRPFQAQLDQARGQLARDQALLANAELDVERYRGLLAKDSIARQQVDAQEALVRQYRGAVQADQAAVDTARLQLAYARITAPISGLLGLRQVDVGNVIRTSDANGIVVITETQPITTVFSVPSDHIAAIQGRLMAQETLQVDLFGRDGVKQLANGRLISIDNQIDATTGTVKLKALFANKDGALFPNQFVNVRLRVESRRNVTLAPVAAVQRGSRGTFVYLVQAGAVSIRPVVLGPVSGDDVAIEGGLAPGDQVVTDGADKLRQGAKVEVVVPDAPRGPREAGAAGRRPRGGP